VGLTGRGHGWAAGLSADHWQLADYTLPESSLPYDRIPRAFGSWEHDFARWFTVGVEGEAVRFSKDEVIFDPTLQRRVASGGSRLDIKPYITMPLEGASWFLRPSVAWRYTAYQIDDEITRIARIPGTPTRSLPIASVDAGAYFERGFDWHGRGYVQTLEPRVYYLYAPYRDQVDLPVFDTRELTFSWNSLFRDNRFGGADRQADANQATVALTSRFLSAEDGRERLSLSLGRIYYVEQPRIDLPGGMTLSSGGSPWVAEADVAISDRWSLGVTQVWDPDRDGTQMSSVRSQYRWGAGGLLNASYRYRVNQLEQTDLSFVLPVSERWNLLGRWNQSLRDGQTLEALGGFEWNSCCVAVRLLARQYVRGFDNQENFGLYLEIELNGVGSFGRDTKRLLDNAILGYTR